MSMHHYDIIKVIGKGTFGRAILVRKKSSKRQLIIKQVTMSQLSQKEKKEALNEVNVLRQLKHPHIIKYRKSFEEGGKLCIVMDYAENGDLYQKIRKRKGKLFSEESIMKWFVQIALALEYTHSKHILHRDLKTQNIFLSKNNDVLLGDFGIARVLQSTMECARTMVGTPYYLSPELCREEPYNHKSDVWSLGCILYELATHRHAFEANSMKGLVGKILRGIYPPISSRYSANLKHLIDICLQKDVRKRPSVFEILKMDYVKQYVQKYGATEEQHTSSSAENSPSSARSGASRASRASRPSSRASAVPPTSHHQQQQQHKRYADPPQFSQYHENKAAEIKARILKKYRKEQDQKKQQRALAEKKERMEKRRQQMEFMEAKRKQMEAEREAARQRASEERYRLQLERQREAEEHQREVKRERDMIYQEQQRNAEVERRKIWQENRAAAMRNKQRLHDHMYGGADIEYQQREQQQQQQQHQDNRYGRPSSIHDKRESPYDRHQQQNARSPHNPSSYSAREEADRHSNELKQQQQQQKEEELAEFRKKQFWEAKIQAMKNRKRVLDQLYGNQEASPNTEQPNNPETQQQHENVVASHPSRAAPSQRSPPSSSRDQDERLNDIQRRRKLLEEEIARKEKNLLERQRQFEEQEELASRQQQGGSNNDARAYYHNPVSSDDDDEDEYDPQSSPLLNNRDDIPTDKFLLNGKTLNISSTSSRDSLCYRIEALRLYLEKELGLESFIESYELLQNQQAEDDDNVLNDQLLSILGQEKLAYVSLIHQLIVCEESFNESQ